VLVKMLGFGTCDNVEGALDAMQYLLRIDDEFSQKRIEWIIGVP